MKKNIIVLLLLLSFMVCIFQTAGAEEQVVSALYFETDIREALNDLMLQTGVNIIADDTVRGLITIDLEDVTLDKALKLILMGGGYSYRKFDDYYLVSSADPRSPAFRHIAVTENVRLNYISASEACKLLPAFYEPYLRSSDERDIITITSTPEIIAEFKEEIKKIDTPPQQIRVQAVVTEVSADFIKESGVDLFDLLTGGVNGNDGIVLDKDGIDLNWYGPHERILTSLKALEKTEELEIKADPRIVVKDRNTGSLFIGEEQVIILEPENASARLERVDVGVSLQVTPRVMAEGQIELTLAPEISHFTEEIDRRLRIRRSEVETTVYTGDGETLVIAGMSIDNQQTKKQKVPILGDVPLLRWFFRQTEDKDGERELIIFITPEIVR